MKCDKACFFTLTDDSQILVFLRTYTLMYNISCDIKPLIVFSTLMLHEYDFKEHRK